MDNGATNVGVGARYKGNTSYTLGGAKKSINLEFDDTNAMANLMRYETINLNNAAADETIMREPLYFNVLQNYTPGPKGSMAKLYINDIYWGVYSFSNRRTGSSSVSGFQQPQGIDGGRRILRVGAAALPVPTRRSVISAPTWPSTGPATN
jgi:hypothetical protein